jgi:integrase
VFTNPKSGTCYDYRDKFLDTLCRRAGVPEFGYHALRHHTASLLAERGAPLTDIQKILGHQRPTTTDNYLQSLGESVRSAMGLLEEGATESATDDFMESGNP